MKKSIANIVNHAEVSEKSIEAYLVARSKELGLPCLKYSNPNMVGYPDRLLVLPGSAVVWVELKSKGKKPTKIQMIRAAELQAMGHTYYCIDSKAGIDDLFNDLKAVKL
jgi:hypothetical protein